MFEARSELSVRRMRVHVQSVAQRDAQASQRLAWHSSQSHVQDARIAKEANANTHRYNREAKESATSVGQQNRDAE